MAERSAGVADGATVGIVLSGVGEGGIDGFSEEAVHADRIATMAHVARTQGNVDR